MKVDISYGGIFYIICDARKLGLDINTCGVDALIEVGDRVNGEFNGYSSSNSNRQFNVVRVCHYK